MEEHQQMIEDCEVRETRMTEWEQNFIDSISRQIETKSLTDKQERILYKIWEKVTEKG